MKEKVMRVREWIIVLAIALSGGCEWQMQGFGPTTKPAPLPTPTTRPTAKAPAESPKPAESYLAKNGLNKEGDAPTQTAVESALTWANKYAQSMQTVTDLQHENREQLKESQTLQQQNVKLQDELTAAQKELKDANALLIEMRQELTKWKADVLGFRSEMKESQQAQLTMLNRVLKVLGSDATPPVPTSASQPATEPTSAPTHK
jgi:hypothetical protein